MAPLDWGLGHATRCIPLIKELQKKGFEIIIAANGNQKYLLQKEFPALTTLPLEGYNIRYTKQKRLVGVKILLQLPKIIFAVHREHKWLEKIIDSSGVELVISDNRYGLWTKKTPCIFLTHQLQIKAPSKWAENLIQKINYFFINRFTQCWVPDFADKNNIAGSLSHPKIFPAVPVKYIGPLSRFEKVNAEIKYDWLVVLSGPEPQRTLFENRIISVAKQLKGRMLIIRGKPGSVEKIDAPGNCSVVNHLPATEMQQAFAESGYIISRSGYTTVMEILAQQKKAILIPTPGQTEQEYLAQHLMRQRWCYCFNQDNDFLFHINKAMEFNYTSPEFEEPSLPGAVNDFFNESA